MYEVAGPAVLSQVQVKPVTGRYGAMDPDDVKAAIRVPNIHFPKTTLICLENTHNRSGGCVVPLENMKAIYELSLIHIFLGRRRPIPEINSRNNIVRRAAERTAINTPIQGSAADIIKLAMVRIHKRFDEEGLSSKMVLQVHDELIFEIPPSEEKIVRKIVETEMEGAIELKVPLTVQIDVGRSWDEV